MIWQGRKLELGTIYYGIFYDGALRNLVFTTIQDAQVYVRNNLLQNATVIEIRALYRSPV